MRGDLLEKVEILEATDLLDAIDRTNPERELTAEIWSKIGKVGMIGPRPQFSCDLHPEPSLEAQITELMKCRLRLVPG